MRLELNKKQLETSLFEIIYRNKRLNSVLISFKDV